MAVQASHGRAVLITGGASGIGAALAGSFVRDGARVTVLDRKASSDPDVTSVVGDVREYADNERAVEAASAGGRLDVLIANAGIHDGGLRLLDADPGHLEQTFRRVLDVDVLGYLLAARAAAPLLLESSGCIALTLSDAAFDVRANGSGIAYATAKHAGAGLLRALARDLAPDVRVNAVAPGGVPTGLVAAEGADAERPAVADPDRLRTSVAARTLLQRGADLAEIVAAFRFLCGPDAGSITGQILRVDAGLLS
jgi:NAD(P)-dependent dehydrogenase (short-subunit alcohol dehydrogenase family)